MKNETEKLIQSMLLIDDEILSRNIPILYLSSLFSKIGMKIGDRRFENWRSIIQLCVCFHSAVWSLAGCRLLLHADADAPEEGQADVFLVALPQLLGAQVLFPGHQVQQEQHGTARQVVQQLQVRFERQLVGVHC